jgi:hypothetical protein
MCVAVVQALVLDAAAEGWRCLAFEDAPPSVALHVGHGANSSFNVEDSTACSFASDGAFDARFATPCRASLLPIVARALPLRAQRQAARAHLLQEVARRRQALALLHLLDALGNVGPSGAEAANGP